MQPATITAGNHSYSYTAVIPDLELEIAGCAKHLCEWNLILMIGHDPLLPKLKKQKFTTTQKDVSELPQQHRLQVLPFLHHNPAGHLFCLHLGLVVILIPVLY